MRTIDFINLSSGVAWLATDDGPKDWSFVRIQSTACEQKRWGFIIEDLSYEFLIHAAMGNVCRIWDTSARKKVSRAIYQGLPWVKYAVERVWFSRRSPALVRGFDASEYFE